MLLAKYIFSGLSKFVHCIPNKQKCQKICLTLSLKKHCFKNDNGVIYILENIQLLVKILFTRSFITEI